MRIIAVLVVATAATFLVAPGIDLWASDMFWDPEHGFFLRDVWWARLLYVSVPKIVGVVSVAGLLVLLHNRVRRRSLGPLTSQRVLYLLLALALGPGLVVNVVFKDHWGRARPRDVAEFGGDRRFTPAFVVSDQCERNCSFVAGHPAVGFLLAGVAFLDRKRRKSWLAAGIGLGTLLGIARIVQGGHFLSDVVFSGVFVVSVCFVLARYAFRFPSHRDPPGDRAARGEHRSTVGGAGPLCVLFSLLCAVGGVSGVRAQGTEVASSVSRVIRLIAVGDIMMGTTFPDSSYLNPALGLGAEIEDVLDERLLALLRSGNVVFGNLEGTLFDGEGATKACRNPELCYAFRSPEHYAEHLRDMGFNLLSLANNHSGDFLDRGREATIAALERNGISSAGWDRPGARTALRRLADGTVVGLVAFSPNKGTPSINEPDRAASLVRKLTAEADIVIVSFHGGAEGAEHTHVPNAEELFHGERRGNVRGFARAVVDAGAHVVLGHGPHVPRAVEIYRNRLIAYSLGNFWTYARFNLRGPNGLAPLLELHLAPDGTLLGARLHSARQRGLGVPEPDPTDGALRLVETLTREDFPETSLEFDAEGTIRWPGAMPQLLDENAIRRQGAPDAEEPGAPALRPAPDRDGPPSSSEDKPSHGETEGAQLPSRIRGSNFVMQST